MPRFPMNFQEVGAMELFVRGVIREELDTFTRSYLESGKTMLPITVPFTDFAGRQLPYYAKVGSLVVVAGSFAPTGALAANDPIATLPAGFRPSGNHVAPTDVTDGPSPYIQADGVIRMRAAEVAGSGVDIYLMFHTTE